jgi:TetR/AcrR family transcriptional regulator, transcriptional repressor for nem operon
MGKVALSTETRPIREGRGTKAAILAVAARIMHVKGYHATSLDDILRESAVGKGNFYHYFKSKEDLGYDILDAAIRSFVERALDPCFADPDANRLGQIRCFLDGLLQSERERNCIGGCPMGNLASELSDVHEGFRAKLAAAFTRWRARLTQALEEGQARGEVAPGCDPVATGRFLVASLEGAMLITKVQKDISVMEQCVAELQHYLSLYDGSQE